MDDDAPADDVMVIIPAGAPIEAAAAWLGAACWAELRFHEVLTAWLAVEAEPERAVALWTVRARAAELAAEWHRRLPELREMPRASFVRPSSPSVEARFSTLATLTGADESDQRIEEAAAVLGAFARGYRSHAAVATGPADGPVADTLRWAVERSGASAVALLGPTTDRASDLLP